MIRYGLVLAVVLAAPLRADSFDDIRLKRLAMLTGGARLDNTLPEIRTRLAAIESNGRRSWASLRNATSSSQGGWSRVKSLAVAWATPGQGLYHDAALLADVRAAAASLEANSYNARIPSEAGADWFAWEIGTPLLVGDVMVLFHDQLTPEELGRYAAAIDRFTPDPRMMIGDIYTTAANRVWKCMVVLLRAINAKDAVKLQLASDALSGVFPYVASGDGFYLDGSFIQHLRFPYTGGYGNSLLEQISDALYLLAGSPWDVKDPARDNVYRWVFDSYEPLVYRGAMMDMVRGREVVRGGGDHGAGHTIAASVLRLSQVAPAGTALRMQSLVKEWLTSDTSRDWAEGVPIDEVLPLSRILSSSAIPARGPLSGSWIFAGMDRVAHVRPAWALGVAMYSSRIFNFESIHNENVGGWHTGDGMTYLYNGDLTQFSNGFWSTVDPQRLPGTTVVAGSKPPGNTLGLNPVAGGATVAGYSAAMMELRPDDRLLVSAHKSWFLLDDAVVALGSAIHSDTPEQHVETIVENRLLTGDPAFTVAENGAWACLGDELGYFFPNGAGWKTERMDRQGSGRGINAGGSPGQISRRYQTIWFDHGVAPQGAASYAYVLLPGKNRAAVAAYAAAPGARIVENSAHAHAIAAPALGLRAVNFWTDVRTSSNGIVSDKIASIIVLETGGAIQVAVADPAQLNSGAIHVEIDRAAGAVIEKDDAISVDQTSPALRLTVNVANAYGKSLKLKCAAR